MKTKKPSRVVLSGRVRPKLVDRFNRRAKRLKMTPSRALEMAVEAFLRDTGNGRRG